MFPTQLCKTTPLGDNFPSIAFFWSALLYDKFPCWCAPKNPVHRTLCYIFLVLQLLKIRSVPVSVGFWYYEHLTCLLPSTFILLSRKAKSPFSFVVSSVICKLSCNLLAACSTKLGLPVTVLTILSTYRRKSFTPAIVSSHSRLCWKTFRTKLFLIRLCNTHPKYHTNLYDTNSVCQNDCQGFTHAQYVLLYSYHLLLHIKWTLLTAMYKTRFIVLLDKSGGSFWLYKYLNNVNRFEWNIFVQAFHIQGNDTLIIV